MNCPHCGQPVWGNTANQQSGLQQLGNQYPAWSMNVAAGRELLGSLRQSEGLRRDWWQVWPELVGRKGAPSVESAAPTDKAAA